MKGPITTPEEFEARAEYLAGMLRARSGVLACGVPVAVLLVAGCQPGSVHPALVAGCLVGELACVLWFNPWGCLNRCLSPLARSLLLLGILLAAMAALMAVMDAPAVAAVLILLAVLAVSVALWRRKAWLLAWQVRQCPEVDTVLSHLSHGGEFAPAAAWEKDGCHQTRALLHQALGVECDENELERLHKAVYELAYLCGMEGRETEVERLKKERDKAQAEAEQYRRESISWKSEAVYRQDAAHSIARVEQELSETREALRAAQAEAAQYRQEAETWRPQEAEGSRDDAIRAYIEAGNSYQKTADKFGLSKTQVYRIINGEAVP